MPPRLSFDSERGGNGLQRPSESGSTSGECLPAGSPKSLSSEPRQKRRGRPADSPKGPSTGLAQKRVSNSSFLELLADGLRATSASLGSRMRASSHSASEEGFEQR